MSGHLCLPWDGGRLSAGEERRICCELFPRSTSTRKTLAGWEPGGSDFPSLLSFFFSSPSHSSSSRRFSHPFAVLTMFPFQRLPKTDSDASKENKETEVRDNCLQMITSCKIVSLKGAKRSEFFEDQGCIFPGAEASSQQQAVHGKLWIDHLLCLRFHGIWHLHAEVHLHIALSPEQENILHPGTLSTNSVQKLQAQRELLDWQGPCQR